MKRLTNCLHLMSWSEYCTTKTSHIQESFHRIAVQVTLDEISNAVVGNSTLKSTFIEKYEQLSNNFFLHWLIIIQDKDFSKYSLSNICKILSQTKKFFESINSPQLGKPYISLLISLQSATAVIPILKELVTSLGVVDLVIFSISALIYDRFRETKPRRLDYPYALDQFLLTEIGQIQEAFRSSKENTITNRSAILAWGIGNFYNHGHLDQFVLHLERHNSIVNSPGDTITFSFIYLNIFESMTYCAEIVQNSETIDSHDDVNSNSNPIIPADYWALRSCDTIHSYGMNILYCLTESKLQQLSSVPVYVTGAKKYQIPVAMYIAKLFLQYGMVLVLPFSLSVDLFCNQFSRLCHAFVHRKLYVSEHRIYSLLIAEDDASMVYTKSDRYDEELQQKKNERSRIAFQPKELYYSKRK